MKMTEKEQNLSFLYKKLLKAQKAYNEGRKNKDYLAVIYDLKVKINELSNNVITDGKIVFRTKKIKNNTVIYSIFELSNDEKLGEISVSTEGKKASINYLFNEQAHKKGLDLSALKLICEHLKNNDIEKIITNVHKENTESNNLIANFGAKKELTSITPYNEYVLKLK